MEESMIINGSIYIKKGPVVHEQEQLLPGLSMVITDKETGNQFVIRKAEDLIGLNPEIKRMFKEQGIIIKKNLPDYNKVGFYQIFGTPTSIGMINIHTKDSFVFSTMKDVREEFFDLDEFLDTASYIGKVISNTNLQALYQNDTIIILRDSSTGEFIVINTNDPRYRDIVLGDMLQEYYDKDGVYKAITSQVTKRTPGDSSPNR